MQAYAGDMEEAHPAVLEAHPGVTQAHPGVVDNIHPVIAFFPNVVGARLGIVEGGSSGGAHDDHVTVETLPGVVDDDLVIVETLPGVVHDDHVMVDILP